VPHAGSTESRLFMTPHADALTRRDRARLMRAVFSSVSEGIVVADPEGTLLFFNDAAKRVLGLGVMQVDASQWSAAYGCFRSEDREVYPSFDLPLARALRGESTRAERLFICNRQVPAGVWISLNGDPVRNPRGEIIGGVVTFRDVTRQVKADAELGALRGRFETLKDATSRAAITDTTGRLTRDALIQRLSSAVEQTADGIFITDRSGVIEYVNPAFETMTGYAAAELIGQTPRVLKSGKQPPAYYDTLWKTILAGEVFKSLSVNRTSSGAEYQAEQTITPLKDPSGEVTHFVSVIKDVTERVSRQAREMEMSCAARVQRGLYPPAPPAIPGFDIAGAVWPAKMTGGDYFDYLQMPGDALGIAIGDVCGHGLASALIMATTRAYLRPVAALHDDPGTILARVNTFLHGDLQHDRQFVTLFLARLDPAARALVYASAGHPPAHVLDKNGTVKVTLQSTSRPLGLFGQICSPTSESLTLEPGDLLVLLTDGVTEAEAPDGGIFGTEGALQVIATHRSESASNIVQHLRDAVRDFSAEAGQPDDVTIVICKVQEVS
jgi:PAS domain S-box-containing protein